MPESTTSVVSTSVEQMNKLGDMLIDQSVPMKARYRALFTLKNLAGKDAIVNISKGFQVHTTHYAILNLIP